MRKIETGNALVFKPTRACPARCDFCCDPKETSHERLRQTEMLALVDRVASELPGLVHTIGFTGGEPFLVFDDVLAVLERAQNHGMMGAVASSSYWANDTTVAMTQLERLKAVGLVRYSVAPAKLKQRHDRLKKSS